MPRTLTRVVRGVSLGAALTAAPLHAEVIEIADDGSAHVVSAPVLSRLAAARPLANGGAFNLDESLDRAARLHKLDPGLLRAVAWRESRGNNAAVSVKGALGVMQLMPGTAAALGVDPRDPDANINGGAAYLAAQLTAFGSVDLALAAYNAGPGAVRRYGGIPPYRETQDYVAAITQRWTGKAPAARVTLATGAVLPHPNKSKAPARAAALPVMLIEVASE